LRQSNDEGRNGRGRGRPRQDDERRSANRQNSEVAKTPSSAGNAPEKAQESPRDDGKPKRTRNNPRNRTRKHALNPQAEAEQQRLQAEAASSEATQPSQD